MGCSVAFILSRKTYQMWTDVHLSSWGWRQQPETIHLSGMNCLNQANSVLTLAPNNDKVHVNNYLTDEHTSRHNQLMCLPAWLKSIGIRDIWRLWCINPWFWSDLGFNICLDKKNIVSGKKVENAYMALIGCSGSFRSIWPGQLAEERLGQLVEWTTFHSVEVWSHSWQKYFHVH